MYREPGEGSESLRSHQQLGQADGFDYEALKDIDEKSSLRLEKEVQKRKSSKENFPSINDKKTEKLQRSREEHEELLGGDSMLLESKCSMQSSQDHPES